MDIQHRSGETKGEFYLEENGKAKAKMTYSKLGNTQIIIDHTEVSDELRKKMQVKDWLNLVLSMPGNTT